MDKRIIFVLLFALMIVPIVSAPFGINDLKLPKLTGDLFGGKLSSFYMPNNNSVFGNFSFNGGWTNEGLSIIDGDIYAQTGYFYNLTSLNVTKINMTVLNNLIVNGNITANNFIGNFAGTWNGSGSYLLNTGDTATGNYTFDTNTLFIDSTRNRVGIGTTAPVEKLDVAGNLRYTGEIILADPNNKDWAIGSDATAVGLYFYNINDGAYRMMIGDNGNVGIGTTAPSYPLEVNKNVSGISIWSQANISATGYNTRTSVFDKSKNVWDYVKDSDYYLTSGKIDHSKFYGYAGTFTITDYSKPVNESYIEEVCEDIIIKDETTQKCHNETRYRIIYPYTKQEGQISINMEIDLLRQAIHELREENTQLKVELCLRDTTYSWCKK